MSYCTYFVLKNILCASFLCAISKQDIIFEPLNLDELWDAFKDRFNKTYRGDHDISRKLAWQENIDLIQKHNEEADKGLHSYYIKENQLGDLTRQVYLQKMVKLTHSRHRKAPDAEIVGDFLKFKTNHRLPEEIDWRKKGFVTPTYNQKDCGSCYAFSIALVLQAQIFKQTKKLVPLSEQQIVDCSVSSGNYGCGGGSLRNTLRYLDKSGGLMAYDDYPYAAKQKKCHFNKSKALVNVTSWAVLPPRSERSLEAAVVKIGPIAVSVDASPRTFQLYHKGIYDDHSCSSDTVNHAMLLVGYTENAWLLKNWWGSHWGENGYMRLRRHRNRCGISNYAAYALV